MLSSIIKLYGLPENECTLQPFGNGLINTTWLIECHDEQYIFQKINNAVFNTPERIADNLHILKTYFEQHYPQYLFISPLSTVDHKEMIALPGKGYFRLFKFVKNSVTYDTVCDAGIAYEAAKQFGQFTNLLSGIDINRLNITLPDFHNLTLRFQQFELALQQGNKERIALCNASITFILAQKNIVDTFNELQHNPHFKKRVTHHDTKISNVLFDTNGKGLCVIDLDTVMPGYFISDVGDMLRTYLSPVSEEENDLSKIQIQVPYFQAIVDGYLSEMNNELSETEKSYFVYAGKFMIYMQAIRFLTDYINDDVYYGAKYETHNLNRCNNQLELLKQLLAKENLLQARVDAYMEQASV